MKEILIIFGTRPEAIKLLPVITEFRKRAVNFEVLNTNQHDKILDDFLAENGIKTDYKLEICGKFEDMVSAKTAMLSQIKQQLNADKYAGVVVQGDTLSALVGAEFGFFSDIPVFHVEAGMRTYNSDNPYPEEVIRRMITSMASVHFCPSEDEKKNLIAEGVAENRICVSGNTFADYRKCTKNVSIPKKQVLVTLHRRENIQYLDNILKAISTLASENTNYCWLFPVHPNPLIVQKTGQYLSGNTNVKLCAPLSAELFYQELLDSEIVISDSGGVHEECLLNSKKIIVLRKVSERTVAPDFVEQVSPQGELCKAFYDLLNRKTVDDFREYYGTGNSAMIITDFIIKEIEK